MPDGKIITERQGAWWHAFLESNPGVWDSGQTPAEAITSLVRRLLTRGYEISVTAPSVARQTNGD